MVTVFVMLFLYLPRKVVTFKGFMESFVEGFKLMIPAIGILIFAWTLKGMGDALQIGTFVESIVGTSASASLFLPAVLFVVAVFLAFSTGTSWGTFAILVPIAIAMFPGADHLEMMIIAVSAVLAGAVCGDHISPISDTTVMSSAGAQSNHINHVTTQMQYAAVVAVVCIISYIIAEFGTDLVGSTWHQPHAPACCSYLYKKEVGEQPRKDSRYIRIRTEAQKQRKEQARKPAPS